MSCPFGYGRQAAASDASAAAVTGAAAASMCPMAGKLQQQQGQAGGDSAAPPPATCPLGFGSARGPKLSTLHCPVCRALLHDACMVTACKHTFCEACITRTRDCPTCGGDVEGLEPNAELSGLVDTFLDTHSKSPELVAAQADLGPLPDNTAASFFMAQGLKSLAGGNVHAALHRLGRCRQELLASSASGSSSSPTPAAQPPAAAAAAAGGSQQQQEEEEPKLVPQHLRRASASSGGDPSAAPGVLRAVQLATVCGCLGDCYLRLEQPGQAEALYKESIAAVQPHAEGSVDAARALSVSLNKLGDARYRAQQLPAAKALYREALQWRQLCCGPLTAGQAGPEQQLELAASLIKVADISMALEEAEEADQLLRRAYGVCCEVRALQDGEALSAAAERKLALLLQVLQAQGHGGSGGGGGMDAGTAAAAESQ